MTTRRSAVRLMGAAVLGAPLAKAALAQPTNKAAAAANGSAHGDARAATGSTPSTAARNPNWRAVTSADGAPRFATAALAAAAPAGQPLETEIAVFVDSARNYQQVFGFGGALTDAVAEVHARLTPAAKQAFLAAYFDPKDGIGYSVLRTSIHSSDFGSESYTYVRDGDRSLASFDIGHDLKLRIPLLRQAIAAGAAAGSPVRVLATPWSAPAWMKSNKSMLSGGSLLPEYADTWARYIVKFVHAYEGAGVPIWGLSVQNEPMAKQTWESMIYTADEETRFLADHLGPTLKTAGLGGKKLLAWDHNRDLLPMRARTVMADPKARGYLWGIAYHWYETWTGGEPMHRNVAAVHEAYPDMNLLMTEGCVEKFDPSRLQSWANAERYGREMIADFNAGAVGWVDWNMLLDSRGGPNHKQNYCYAPIHASDDGQLVFTPIYTALGHFSRYVRPQARRIGATTSRSTLNATAFRNPDGALAIVVMNRSDAPVRYRLHVDGMETRVEIPARALQTVLA